ncbi:hypothetical protein DM860_017417 [Cuscuta australis]|uniref:Photosystem I assembly protein Ycf3 n=1 Tax=Cuscuta australis TaxID=267555 RepID=A0A328CXP4_9ASTE|nr:hypothetical protein DM860_017417 [Cuscuta australis]
MPISQKNQNFIDRTFSIIANILLRIIPTTSGEKEAFAYYINGMSAQSEGNYAEALQNYYQAMHLEMVPPLIYIPLATPYLVQPTIPVLSPVHTHPSPLSSYLPNDILFERELE